MFHRKLKNLANLDNLNQSSENKERNVSKAHNEDNSSHQESEVKVNPEIANENLKASEKQTIHSKLKMATVDESEEQQLLEQLSSRKMDRSRVMVTVNDA